MNIFSLYLEMTRLYQYRIIIYCNNLSIKRKLINLEDLVEV